MLPIAGTPACRLDMYPANGTIKLITEYAPPEPDVAMWHNIRFEPVASDEGDLAELTVVVEGNVHGAYGLLASVADQLQLVGDPLAAAVATAVAKHRNLFAGKSGLSPEKEVGLFGELLVLEYLIGQLGPGPAVESWQGPLSEEHDFVFGYVHLEIKTTSGEQRRHMIHGLTQLVPLRDISLSLISIQLTRTHHEGGLTLGQMVSGVRAKAGGHRPTVDARLEALGWNDVDLDLYTTFWCMRNQPRAFSVDETFPALIASRLAPVVPNFEVVSDISYRVDLTNFDPHALPGVLAGLVSVDEER